MTGTAQRRSATHTISIVLSRGETTSPTFAHLPIRPPWSWHRPQHFGLSCHVLCHCLEDEIWWQSATKHVPVVSASLRLRTQSVQFGSDTVPHQLENNPRAVPSTQTRVNVFLQTTRNITKAATYTPKQLERQLLRRLCEATVAITANTRPEHTLLAGQNRRLQGVCKSTGVYWSSQRQR